MGLLQYRTLLPVRMFIRYTSNTRLQVFQNAIQIVDPQRIRNVGIIAHIDAGILRVNINRKKSRICSRKNNDG